MTGPALSASSSPAAADASSFAELIMKLEREFGSNPRIREAVLDDDRTMARLLKPGRKMTAGDVIPLSHVIWQVGNYVDDNEIFPLDIEFAPIFKKHRLQLRNRIVWQFGHGLHTQRRFSGRYEVVMWYTKTESKNDNYTFNLDAVRTPAKYPGKKHFKGPKAGQFSGNPLGKNPEDAWNIPNVKSNHIEKTSHPCQFPVGLIERLVLALTNQSDLVFDPFAGVASAGVAAAMHGRRLWGCEWNADLAIAA